MVTVFTEERLKKLALAAPFLPLIFLFRDVLFGGRILYDGDTARVLYQYLDYISKGQSLINQQILSGFPLPVSVIAGWFYPIYDLMFVFFDAFDTYRFLIIINIFLAYVFAYFYSKKIGFSPLVSAIVSTIFIFSGQMIAWFTTLTNTNYYFILPAVLYFAEFVRQKKHKFLFLTLTGIFLGASWLSGHSQFVLYIHAFLAVYYLYWAFLEKSLKGYLEQLVNLVTVYGVSLIIGWPQIWAIISFKEVTARAEGLSLSDFWLNSYPLQGLVHYILPFFKNPIIQTGSPNLYVGILPFILLIFTFLVFRKIKNKHFYLYLSTFVFCLLASIKYSPIGFLLHQIPFFDSLRVGSRIMFIGNLAAAVIVGFVLEYITENKEEVSKKLDPYLNIIKKVFLYILAPIITVGSIVKVFFTEKILFFLNGYFLNNLYSDTAGLPKEHYLNLVRQYLDHSLASVFIFQWDILIFIIFAILSFLLLKRMNKFSTEIFLTLALIVVSLNFTFVYARHFNSVSKEELLSVPMSARFILSDSKDEKEFRIFTPFTGIIIYNNLRVECSSKDISEELSLQKELLTPSINLQYGLDSIDGYDPYMPLAVAEMIGYLGSEHTTADYSLAWESIPMEKRLKKFVVRKNILKSMNVRYVISAYEINDPDFKKVFSEEVGECKTKVSIYELAGYWPRNFVTSDESILSGDDSFQVTMDKLENQDGKISITEEAILSQNYGHDSINFEVNLDRDALLFIGNAWLPGWHVYVDSVETEILKANHIYMALPLSGGRHQVELKYK